MLATLHEGISLSIIIITFIFLVNYPATIGAFIDESGSIKSHNGKQVSNTEATFTLEVIDVNKTANSNQTTSTVNSTQGLSILCDPVKITLYQGKLSTINCNVDNNSKRNMDLTLQIIGLENTGIKYTINGYENTDAFYLPSNSSKIFRLGMLDSNIQKEEIGKSYDYILRVNCSVSIECY